MGSESGEFGEGVFIAVGVYAGLLIGDGGNFAAKILLSG